MNILIDQATRESVPGIGSHLQRVSVPGGVALNLKGTVTPEKAAQCKHTVNPAKAVKLTQDKTALMKHLGGNQIHTAPYFPPEMFQSGNAFDLESFKRVLDKLENEQMMYRDASALKDVSQLADLLEGLSSISNTGVFQAMPKDAAIASISAMPKAVGHKLNPAPGMVIQDGIVQSVVPDTAAVDPATLANRSLEALTSVGLDFGHVIFAINPADPMDPIILDISVGYTEQTLLSLVAYLKILDKIESKK